MKRIFLAVVVIILLIFVDVSLGFTSEYKTASVVEVTGMVSIFKAGGEKPFIPKVGTVLEHGDRIITSKGASIALQIDAQYIKVGEKTYMSLSELMSKAESGGDSTSIKLFTGEVWASIRKPLGTYDIFQIETPTAVMGAKGTRFLVKYVVPTLTHNEQSGTGLVVLEGKVTMNAQAPVLDGPGTEPTVQDIEMTANANEILLFGPELIQAISDEIEKRLKSGEVIDQINIQDLAMAVAKAKHIEVQNLDLFVLEIIADEPDKYDPTLSQGIDQLIDQKNMLPLMDDFFEEPDIISYSPLSTFGNEAGAGIPVIPDPPQQAGLPDLSAIDDFENGPGEIFPIPIEFYATSAATIDADGDGIVDHLQITFNNPVDDSTFIPERGIVLNSDGELDPIDDSVMVKNLTGEYTDIANDAVVYFKLDHTASTILYNTGGTGELLLPSGTLRNLMGLPNKKTYSMTTLDHAAPVFVDAELDLSLPYDEKFISLKFSEPLNESDTVDISKIKLMSSGMFGNGPIDLYGTTSVLGDQIVIRPLQLGSALDEVPSFISMLSNELYFPNNPIGGVANIRLNDGFSITSNHGESYALPTNQSYPYDGPMLSSIKRINSTSGFSSVLQDDTALVLKVTYTDYLQSWNQQANGYMSAMTNVILGEFTVVSQKIGGDHKTIELELSSLPVVGDEIEIKQVRNITNSFGDDINVNPVYAQDVLLQFDGTNWNLAD